MFNVLRPWNSKGRIWKAYEYYDYPPKRSSLSSFPRYRYNREVRIARYHCSVRYNNDNHVSTNIVSIFNNYLSVVYTLLRVIRRSKQTDKSSFTRYLYRQKFFFFEEETLVHFISNNIFHPSYRLIGNSVLSPMLFDVAFWTRPRKSTVRISRNDLPEGSKEYTTSVYFSGWTADTLSPIY